MLKQTFKNLPAERQEAILQIAYEEFALKGYQNASLSTIIKKIGIAKGSFYRYFSSKKNLFIYLLEAGTGRRFMNLDRIVENKKIGFFELLKQNLKAIINSDKENPVVSGFLYQVMHERDNSEVSKIINTLYLKSIERTKEILKITSFRNELNNTGVDFTAFHIFYSQLWFYDYIALKYNINYEKKIRNHLPVLNLPYDEVDRVIDMSVELLRNGLRKK